MIRTVATGKCTRWRRIGADDCGDSPPRDVGGDSGDCGTAQDVTHADRGQSTSCTDHAEHGHQAV